MPPFSFVSPTIFVGAFDVTSDLNKIDGSYNPEFLDVTNFGSGGWHTRISGLNDVDFNAEGFNDYTASTGVDTELNPLLGAINVVTVAPNSTATAGDAAYLFQALYVANGQSAEIGQAAKFTGAHKGKSQMVRGFVSAPRVSRTATASASAVQAGTASGGKVFATRHIFSVTGNSPTLASFIEQATNAAMINAVTRATFSTASTVGGEWVSTAVTTTAGSYWRASWVVGGTGTPTFDFSIGLAII